MFKNLKIRTTILIALFMGLAMPMIVATSYLQNKYEQALKNELIKVHQELLETISSGLSRPMWEFMHDSAKNLTRPLFGSKDILEIEVMDMRNEHKPFLFFKKEKIYDNINCSKKQEIVIVETVKLNTVKLGNIFMRFSICKINDQIIEQRDNLWLIMISQFTISFIILFLLIHLKIIIPVKKLITQSHILARKKLHSAFIWEQNDEMGLLGQSLEKTREALTDLFDKEKNQKNKLKS